MRRKIFKEVICGAVLELAIVAGVLAVGVSVLVGLMAGCHQVFARELPEPAHVHAPYSYRQPEQWVTNGNGPGLRTNGPRVKWVGRMATADRTDNYRSVTDANPPRREGWSLGVLTNVEVGLRSDGVVIWREAK